MAEKLSSRQSTAITTAGYFHIIIPSGTSYISKRIPFGVISDAINLTNSPNKGYFPTEAALVAEFPVGEAGWYAIVGTASPTLWLWDPAVPEWYDTTQSGLVVSVNGNTGTVVLTADDIGFSSLEGLAATTVRAGIDEVKTLYDTIIADGINVIGAIYEQKTVTVSPGTPATVTFDTPFSDATYDLQLSNLNGGNCELDNVTQLSTGFQLNVTSTTVLSYLALKDGGGSAFTDSDAIHKSTAGEISSLPEKGTPTVNDWGILEDDADGDAKKRYRLGNTPILAGSGTVTSVNASSTKLTVAGGPITTAGALSIEPNEVTATFVSGDLSGGDLAINHALGVQYINSVVIYDSADRLVNHANFDYVATDANNGTISFYLPITGTWRYILRA